MDINPRPALVGREEELAALARHLEDAMAGRGRLVLIGGEAGIGKTRLVDEVKALAAERGFTVLEGNCLFESLTPYMPFREALRSGGLEYLFAEDAPRVEGAYVVTNTGLLVTEAVRAETRLDANIFAGMLTTVGGFVAESMAMLGGGGRRSTLNRLGYGGYTILVEGGPSASLIAVVVGKENEFLLEDMREALTGIHREYGDVLQRWSGDDATVPAVRRYILSLVESGKYDGVSYGTEDPKARRNLLFESVALGLSRHAQERPLLLCLEDLQWADPSTLALLHYVARNTRGRRVLALGTYRPEDLTKRAGEPHPLVDAMQRMDREELSVEIQLHRLSAPETAEVASSVLGGGSLGDELARRIQEDTEGNPLFLVEFVKLMGEEGLLLRHNGGWSVAAGVREVKLPRKLQEIILRRLSRVDRTERQLLDIAAVNGEEFVPGIVASAAGLDSSQLAGALRELEQRHRLIRSRDGRYLFDHAKIKETLYDDLPREVRSEYHGLVAAAMEAQSREGIDERAAEIAFHYYRSRERTKALPYLLKSADRATKQYANAEAVRFYVEALELEKDREKRGELLISLGSTYDLMGEYGRALESYESALDVTAGESRAETLAKMAGTHYMKGDFEDSTKRSLEALTLVAGKGVGAEAHALSVLGNVHWSRGEYSQSLEHHTKALEIREKVEDQRGIAASLNDIGIVHHYRGGYDAALEHHTKALEIREKTGDRQGIAMSLNNIGIVHAERGDYDGALEYFTKCLGVAEKIGDQQSIALSLNNIGALQAERGDYGAALEHHAKCLSMVEKIGDQQGIAMSLDNIGSVHAERGDYDAALEYFMAGLEVRERIRDQRGIASSLNGIGVVHRGRGDYDAALACLERGLAISRSIGARHEESQALCLLADVEFRRGKHQRATDLCGQALSLATVLGGQRNVAESRMVLGTIFRERKMWPESIENFERSVHIYQDIHHPIGEARSCFEFGLMWKEKGDLPDAIKYLGRAVDIFRRLGMNRDIAKALVAYETVKQLPESGRADER